MISKSEHLELEKLWKRHHAVYQRTGRRHRLKFFMEFVDNFKGKDVLELGCNAGLYGYEIAQVAKSYIGIDQGTCYIKQAQITKTKIANPNVTFVTRSVKGYIDDAKKTGKKPPINALFASFVLYHLSEKEIVLLEKEILPLCDVIVISTRIKKRTMWKKNNQRKLFKPENVEKYFEKAGFKCKTKMGPDKKFVITVAKRKRDADDNRDSEGD
jgi:hypothetical protein